MDRAFGVILKNSAYLKVTEIFFPGFFFFFLILYFAFWDMLFPGGASAKEPTYRCRRQKTQVWSLDWEDPLKEGMATTPVFLPWESTWTAELGGLQSVRSQRVRRPKQLTHTHTRCEILVKINFFCRGHPIILVPFIEKTFCSLMNCLYNFEKISLVYWGVLFLWSVCLSLCKVLMGRKTNLKTGS